jgi:hypothetical protein
MEISRPAAAKRILILEGTRHMTLNRMRGKDGCASNVLFDTGLRAVRKMINRGTGYATPEFNVLPIRLPGFNLGVA